MQKSEGHRKRLRDKFLKSGIDGFHDYEIVELLLTLGTPRKDCKPQAKKAIKKFKTLSKILEAPPEELRKIKGIGTYNYFGIKLIPTKASGGKNLLPFLLKIKAEPGSYATIRKLR